MNEYQVKLKQKMDEYVRLIYGWTKDFPVSEMYGITSQLRRSTLSIALNYVEGYARNRSRVRLNFLEISYGSLKESKYLVELCAFDKLINKTNFKKADKLVDEIGAMLWTEIKNLLRTAK
jgi:four helix bundle protein